MSFILSFLTGPGGLYALLMAAIGAALLWARRSGVKSAQAKQAKAEAKARDISDEIDDAVAGRAPAKNREELKTWRKP